MASTLLDDSVRVPGGVQEVDLLTARRVSGLSRHHDPRREVERRHRASRMSVASRPSSIRAIRSLARRTAAWEMRWLIRSWPVVSVTWLGSPGFAGAMSVVEAAGWARRRRRDQHPQPGDEDRLGERAGRPRRRRSARRPSRAFRAFRRRMADWEMRWLIRSWPVVRVMSARVAGLRRGDDDRPRVGRGERDRRAHGVGHDPGRELARGERPLAEVAPLDAVVEPGLDAVRPPDRRLVDALVDQELAGRERDVAGSPGVGGGTGGRTLQTALATGAPAPKRRA